MKGTALTAFPAGGISGEREIEKKEEVKRGEGEAWNTRRKRESFGQLQAAGNRVKHRGTRVAVRGSALASAYFSASFESSIPRLRIHLNLT